MGSIRKNEFQVSTYTNGDQSSPFPIAFPDGRFLITWQSLKGGSAYEIYAKIYASNGNVITSDFLANTNTTGDHVLPRPATLANGAFLITWTSRGQDGDGSGVYAQRFDTNGGKVGSEFKVNIYTTSSQDFSYAASLGSQGSVIAWQSNNQEGSSWEIYMQKYDSSGNPLYSTDIRVNSFIDGDQSQTTLDVFSDNRILITWHSINRDGSGYGIFMRIVDPNGDSIDYSDVSCSRFTNICNSPSMKTYNTATQLIYDLGSYPNQTSQGHNPYLDFLDQRGLIISFSVVSAIQNNENVVNSLGNGLEASLYDVIAFGISSALLCVYVLCQRRHLDSAGKCYDKQTGLFTNTLKNFSRELSGVAQLYWFIRPLCVYIQANRLFMKVDYKGLCDQFSQQALFVLLFFLAKTFKLSYFRRLMELKMSSQKGILTNWRVLLQDILVITLVSSIQVFLPSKIRDTSFWGKLTGNIVYYVFVYLWADQAIEWMRDKVCVDFLPLFSNANLTHYIRSCRYYNKAELYFLTTQELCKRITSDIREKFNATELILIDCTKTKSSTQYELVSKNRATRALKPSVCFRIERYRDRSELNGITSSMTTNIINNSSDILSVRTPESKLLLGPQQRSSTKQGTTKLSRSAHDLCFFIPIGHQGTYKESDILLMDMKSGQEVTWKFEHSSPCSLVYSPEKQTLLVVTPKSSSDNLTARVYEQKNKHKLRTENTILSELVHLLPNNLFETAPLLSLKDRVWNEAQMIERQIRHIPHQKTAIKLDMSVGVDIDQHLYKKHHKRHVWSSLAAIVLFLVKAVCRRKNTSEMKIHHHDLSIKDNSLVSCEAGDEFILFESDK